MDALDDYFARYLPQLVLAVIVPGVVLARILAADWLAAVTIAVTLPLIPVFMAWSGCTRRRHNGPAVARRWPGWRTTSSTSSPACRR